MTLYGNEQTARLAPALANPVPMGVAKAGHGVAHADGYRADIDGLRALAVAVVVIFHAGVSPLRGGFIGVDIFFVISGYLITRQISADLERGAFSILSFYERRVRRIVPALLFTIAVTLAIAPFVLFPTELMTSGMTAAASILSVANLYLLTSAGYFAADAGTQPLVHMWSLGVEEQFYLFFPLLLAAFGGRSRAAARWTTLLLAVTSFALCVVLTRYDRDFAYYFPLTRAWELLAGASLVFVTVPRLSAWMRNVAAAGALLLIAASALRFYPQMAFPGFYALAPCLAAMTLIAVGSQGGSAVTTGLSAGPLVWIGQISYSLYLVHWPILVFYRMARGVPIGTAEAWALVAASVAAAYVSWRFVERPFREKRFLATRPALFAGTGIAGAALVLIAALISFAPLPTSSSEANRLASFLTYDDADVYRKGRCFLFGHQNRLSDFNASECLQPVSGKPNILVVGDSHAADLWYGLKTEFPSANVMQATSTGCKPVLGTRGEKTCIDLMEMALGPFLQSARPDVIILSARWIDSDIPDVERTLKALAGKAGQVVVLGPIAEYAMPLPRLLAQVSSGRDPSLLVNARLPDQEKTDRHLGAALLASQADYVSIYRMLCATESASCQTIAGDVPIQWDYGHLTAQGSQLVARKLREGGVLTLPAERANGT
ncbi:acyltransferase [Rhizobium sp. TH2]|uniref:acyltransferase family protein n=1 Tax=Rhizobium sp. TH2 TaxID=2775403 RepID=UPI002157D6C4|nr:acyltransferase family protein [Rhizobium sp. TH2]UVC08624.1 acyltransferase [Rhizobium sp. TH2]